MKKLRLYLVCAIAFFCLAGSGRCEDIKAEYEKLQKEYAKVVADRDNILLQSKSMLECSQRYAELERKYTRVSAEFDKVNTELLKAKDEAALLNKAVTESKSAADEKTKALEIKADQLVQENDKLKNSLEKVSIEYKIVPETKREIARLQSEKKELSRQIGKLEAKVKSLDAQRLDGEAQITVYRKQISDFKKKYEKAMATNRTFERKAEQVPAKFAEIARENRSLVKETALMHYNLGVFYSKNKEYPRAIAEFEKSIELNPEDPYAHFNLGYIYAEYLVDRPKAILNFRKYLSLLKTDDKDADWVKKYILTWQTWEGKKPIE